MRAPSVSVIMVTYNYGRFIREALDSLLRQTYQDFEVIVVDDGSTDGTAALVRPYLNRVTYLPREHRGHIPGRKEGIRVSRGRYLCFFDADDLYAPNKLALQAPFLDAHPEIDFVFADFCRFDETGIVTPSFMTTQKRFQLVPYRSEGIHRVFTGSLAEAQLRGDFLYPGSLMVRRDYVTRVGVFDDSFKARAFYGKFVHTIRDAKVAYTDAVLVKRRLHSDMISKKSELVNRSLIQVYRKLLNERAETLSLKDRLFVKYRLGRSYAGLLATLMAKRARPAGTLRWKRRRSAVSAPSRK